MKTASVRLIMKIVPLILILLISACSTPEQRLEKQRREIASKYQLFNGMPELYVCGKFYRFEHFTGKREFIYKTDEIAANEVVRDKKINCEKYYSELLRINGANAIAYLEAQERKENEDKVKRKIEENERNLRDIESKQRQLESRQREIEDAARKLRRY